MGKSYQRKTRRSRRKVQDLQNQTVTVDLAEGKASFQRVLPMNPLLLEVAGAIEQTASQAGLLMMKALIDEEVEQIAGGRYTHQADRQATRWGQEEGHVIFAGRKVALPGRGWLGRGSGDSADAVSGVRASAADAGGGGAADSAAGVHAGLCRGPRRGLRRVRDSEELRLAALEGGQPPTTTAVARTAAGRSGLVRAVSGRQRIP